MRGNLLGVTFYFFSVFVRMDDGEEMSLKGVSEREGESTAMEADNSGGVYAKEGTEKEGGMSGDVVEVERKRVNEFDRIAEPLGCAQRAVERVKHVDGKEGGTGEEFRTQERRPMTVDESQGPDEIREEGEQVIADISTCEGMDTTETSANTVVMQGNDGLGRKSAANDAGGSKYSEMEVNEEQRSLAWAEKNEEEGRGSPESVSGCKRNEGTEEDVGNENDQGRWISSGTTCEKRRYIQLLERYEGNLRTIVRSARCTATHLEQTMRLGCWEVVRGNDMLCEVRKAFLAAVKKLERSWERRKARSKHHPKDVTKILQSWVQSNAERGPFPTDIIKRHLSSETGLTRRQVDHWFSNYRKRVWSKPFDMKVQTRTMNSTEAGDEATDYWGSVHSELEGSHSIQ